MTGLEQIRGEFVDAKLGDRRLERRLVTLAEQVWACPERSFPGIAPTQADLTGCYRFLGNSAVSADRVMQPHVDQTMLRCAQSKRVVVVHDTTEVEFAGSARRSGLGRLRGANSQGFLLHTSLAVAGDGSRRPLGVLAAKTLVRESLGSSRDEKGRKKSGGAYADQTHKESSRWWELIDQCEARLGGVEAIHVFDREGDAYVLLRTALDNEARFVTRMARDRVVLDENDHRIGRASEQLVDVGCVASIEIALSARAPKPIPGLNQAPRHARRAKVAVGATPMLLSAPNYIDGDPQSLDVNVVYVRELEAPPNVEPIAWVLVTSEPIDTAAQVLQIVELYRTRWLIEEYFRALKQGCALEKRQLESLDTIRVALAIFMPVAWQLLLLRSLERTEPEKTAQLALTPTQLEVLRAFVPHLPPNPTISEALRAVAYLGGHFIKRPPGWIVLGRGLEKLLDRELGWRARGKSDRT